MVNNIGPPIEIPEFTTENWLPMEPYKGPPLPRFLDIYWPWYKPKPPLPPIYTCPYCEAQFSTEEELLNHIAAEHPEQPPVVYYTCPYCGVNFASESELMAHIAAEHPELPPEEGIAQLLSVQWELIEYPFIGDWGETIQATFCKGILEVNSNIEFIGKIELRCPNAIAPVRLLTEYSYQQILIEIDEKIATTTGAAQELWLARKGIAQVFPVVDGLRIDYRWYSDWDYQFRSWINGAAVAALTLSEPIVAGTSIVNIGFFKRQGVGITQPVTISLYKNTTLLDVMQSNIAPVENIPALVNVSIPVAKSGEPFQIPFTIYLPELLPGEQYYGLTLSIGQYSANFSKNFLSPNIAYCIGNPEFVPLDNPYNTYDAVINAEAVYSRIVSGRWVEEPIPRGVYPVRASLQSWRVGCKKAGQLLFYDYGPVAKYDFGTVGELVVK